MVTNNTNNASEGAVPNSVIGDILYMNGTLSSLINFEKTRKAQSHSAHHSHNHTDAETEQEPISLTQSGNKEFPMPTESTMG